MMNRAERSFISEWWWTVDRSLLVAILALMVIGIVLGLAASPGVAARIGIDNTFHFVNRQVMFLIPALIVLLATSMLDPVQIRRLSLLVLLASLALIAATLLFGAEVKGARRWITILGVSLQPSETLKPAFVVTAAWLFGESAKRPEMPATPMALLLLAVSVGLLVMQPDFGQTMLIAIVWCALFFLAGMRWIWVFGLGGAGVVGLLGAYRFSAHVKKRIDRFMNPESGDTYQMDMAHESFIRGGWLGKGPGEGTVKRLLPDSHTDFIFSVAAEEFGVVLCLIIVSLFAFIVLRSLVHARREEDPFCRFAIAGLAMVFGVQAAINMAVNLHLMPAKGMTLPFISYGGSSLISLAFGMGMLLALTRRRPTVEARANLDKALRGRGDRSGQRDLAGQAA